MSRFSVCGSAIGFCVLLGACGGGGGDSLLSGGGGSAASALNYGPAYADGPTDTTTQSLVGEDITGILHLNQVLTSNVSLGNARVRLNADRTVAFLSINGGAEVALPVNGTAEEGGGVYGDINDPNSPVLTLSNLNDYSLIGYTRGIVSGFGHAGIETREADLPAASATYSGAWGGQVYPLSVSGTFDAVGGGMEMVVDFGSGDVSGTLDRDFADIGTIDGSVSGNGVAGKFNLTSGEYVGGVDFAGKFFGDEAESVAGAYGDTVTNTGTGETQVFVGTFNGER